MSCEFCGPTLGSNDKCPEHGVMRFDGAEPGNDPSDMPVESSAALYSDAASEADAIGLHAREHLCTRCAMIDLCKFAPEPSGLLIAVTRCRGFARGR